MMPKESKEKRKKRLLSPIEQRCQRLEEQVESLKINKASFEPMALRWLIMRELASFNFENRTVDPSIGAFIPLGTFDKILPMPQLLDAAMDVLQLEMANLPAQMPFPDRVQSSVAKLFIMFRAQRKVMQAKADAAPNTPTSDSSPADSTLDQGVARVFVDGKEEPLELPLTKPLSEVLDVQQ